MVLASQVTPRPVDWFWSPYVPLGKVSCLEGPPGTGKGFLAADLAARVTTGSSAPLDGPGMHMGGALWLGAEDDLADTVVPRLLAAGARLDQVGFLTSVGSGVMTRAARLPDDLHILEQRITDLRARLVIIEPLSAFTNPRLRLEREQPLRELFTPLTALAQRTGAAVIVVRHLTKARASSAIYQGLGGVGITAAVRALLTLNFDPDDPDRRVLAVAKSTTSVKPSSLVFALRDDPQNGTATVHWLGPSAWTAEDLAAAKPAGARQGSHAVDLLLEQLASGPVLRSTVERAAASAGIGWRTVEEAKARLGVQARQLPVPGQRGRGPSWWALPGAEWSAALIHSKVADQ